MATPLANDAFFLGTRYYRCVGDWALPDIVSVTGDQQISTTNAIGTIPGEAISVDIGGTSSHRAIGVANTSSIIYFTTWVIPGNIGGGGDQMTSNAIEPAGLVAGEEFAAVSFIAAAYLTDKTADPEFTLNFATAGLILTDLRIRGYWMP